MVGPTSYSFLIYPSFSCHSPYPILQGLRKYVVPRPVSPGPLIVASKVFIAEITARAFIVADSNKRRTLSRADIAKALSKSDQFDFLIDIVPRDEPFVPGVTGPGKNATKKSIPGSTSAKRDAVRRDRYPVFTFPQWSNLLSVSAKQSAQDVQGEAQGDPIILEGGDSANVDGLPHSGMLEQVRILIPSLHPVTVTRTFTQLQTLLDSPMDRPPI